MTTRLPVLFFLLSTLACLGWTGSATADEVEVRVKGEPVRELLVMPGDTLWSIAEANLPPDEVSVQRYVLAILRENPHAFADGNINGLLAGAKLRLPAGRPASAASPDEPFEADRQNAAWLGGAETHDEGNKPPEFQGTGNLVLSVRENATGAIGGPMTATDPDGDAVAYRLAGADAALFAVDAASGQLSVGAATILDFETQTAYGFEVVASDPHGLEAWRAVVVTSLTGKAGAILIAAATAMVVGAAAGAAAGEAAATKRDEENGPPEFRATGDLALTVRKNATGAIGDPVTATDLDGDAVTYHLTGADAALFAVDTASGQLSILGSIGFDLDERDRYGFEVVASDPDGLQARRRVVVTFEKANEAPVFAEAGDLALTVRENAIGAIGGPMTATDPDGDAVTYRLTGADAALFAVDTASGQLSILGSIGFDLDERDKYGFEVAASDAGGLEARRTVAVTVLECGLEDGWRALVALYNATEGANWTTNDNWSPSLDRAPTAQELRLWHGITLSKGCVTRLEMTSNNLTGSLPPELGNLAKLEVLRLGENNLTGSIPPQLGGLSDLKMLMLYSNGLTGPIPPELGRLADLQFLYLDYNELSGSLPREFGSLVSLEVLRLYGNKLTGPIPPEWGGLANLNQLYVQSNSLTGSMPSSLTNLNALSSFYWYSQQVPDTETALCAPTNDVFRSWLEGIETSGDNCTGAAASVASAASPGIRDVSIISNPGLDGVYAATEVVEVAVRFDEPVIVAGRPRLWLGVGNRAVPARHVAVEGGAAALSFRYTVVRGDHDVDGVSIGADALRLNGGSITGADGAMAATALGEHAIKDAAEHIVEARAQAASEKALLEDALAAQGRAHLASVTGVIGERFRAGRATPLRLADGVRNDNGLPIRRGAMDARALPTGAGGSAPCAGLGGSGNMAWPGGACATGPFQPSRTMPGRGMGNVSPGSIFGRNFAIPLGGAQGESLGSGWTLWGANDVQTFRGARSRGSYDGDLRSLYLGIDGWTGGDWLAGVALSHSRGETAYGFEIDSFSGDGSLHTRLTSIYPYLHGRLSSGLEVWSIAGLGSGEAVLQRRDPGPKESTGLELGLGAFGVRQGLKDFGTLRLSLLADAGIARLQTDAGSRDRTVDGLSASATRFRAGVEGQHALVLAGGGSLRPFWQASLRYDGGDGLMGKGMELAGGVGYNSERLEVQVQARWLAVHSSASQEEYGASATLRIKPNADGLGLTAALSPQWGAPGVGAESMWREDILRASHDMTAQPRGQYPWSMDGRMDYGIALSRAAGILRPFGELRLAGTSPVRQRFGVYLGRSLGHESLGVEVGVARVGRLRGGTTSAFDLTIEARF